MAADIAASLNSWSATAASNQPDNSDSVGPNILAENLRQIQAVVKANVAGSDTIASASTCDIGSKEASYLAVSGTTTITSLGSSVAAGIVKTLKFDGALTLTHNGTSLILPGAANITTVAGDVAVFRCESSGNWRCLSYTSSNDRPYEHGTFTPAFTSSGATFAYSTQSGRYTRIGRLVTLEVYIVLAAAGNTLSANYLYINGLPFSAALPARGVGKIYVTSGTLMNVAINGSSATFEIDATPGGIASNVLGNSAQLSFTVTYSI